jgi:hypothetical protein
MIIPRCIPYKYIYNDNESRIFYKETFSETLVKRLAKLGFYVENVYLEDCSFYIYDYDQLDELEENNTELTVVYIPNFKKQSLPRKNTSISV